MFLDTAITDADLKRYSLILIRADANRVREFASGYRCAFPQIRTHRRQEFKTRAAVQMLYQIGESERYLWIFAGGHVFQRPINSEVNGLPVDGRCGIQTIRSPEDLRVV